MKVKFLFLLTMVILIPFSAQTQTAELATGFIYPVLEKSNLNSEINIQDPLISRNDPLCVVNSGNWYVDGNDFGNDYCPVPKVCNDPNDCDSYHPGEDWNICPNNSSAEEGDDVYSVANGKVVGRGVLTSLDSDGNLQINGCYLTIAHTLPSPENLSASINSTWDLTSNESSATIYSSYLHVNNPSSAGDIAACPLAINTIVKKGEKIATISNCCGHLHFEMKMQVPVGMAANCRSTDATHCPGFGYCNTRQLLLDNHYVEPKLFIRGHTKDITLTAVGGDVSTGLVDIVGRSGFFRSTQGQGDVRLKSCPSCGEVSVPIVNWDDDKIRIDLFSSLTDFNNFKQPVSLKINRDNGNGTPELVAAVLTYPLRDVFYGDWFTDKVVGLWKNNVVKGHGATTYYLPGSNINRVDYVKMIVIAAGKEDCDWYKPWNYCPTNDPGYADVDVNAAYYPYVKIAYNLGWIDPPDPTKQNQFFPAALLQRDQAAKILVKAMGKDGQPYTPNPLYQDVQDSSAWYYPYVYLNQGAGTFKGYPENKNCQGGSVPPGEFYFCPAQNLNRAEAAKVICNGFFGCSSN